MVNPDGETPAPSSGATAQAATSSIRPIVMPEAFSAAGNEEWDSWLSHFEDCAVINEWNDARKAQFLAVRMRGARCSNYRREFKIEERRRREARPEVRITI